MANQALPRDYGLDMKRLVPWTMRSARRPQRLAGPQTRPDGLALHTATAGPRRRDGPPAAAPGSPACPANSETEEDNPE